MTSNDANDSTPDQTPEPGSDDFSVSEFSVGEFSAESLLSSSGLNINLLLCDSAQSVQGKLYILGGGLSVIGPKPQSVALALHVRVPWDRANVAHLWKIRLLDEDHRPVKVGEKEIVIQGRFEAGRPAGLRPGTPLGVALAINITPIPLPQGRSYTFALAVDDDERPEWRVGFFVRPAPQS